MPELSVEGLELVVQGRLLFPPVSFQVEKGDRLGVVGRNGVGKSTLLAALSGERAPDGGTVKRRVEVAHLKQLPASARDMEVEAFVLAAHGTLQRLRARRRALQEELQSVRPGEEGRLLARYQRIEDRLEQLGDAGFETRVRSALFGLGLDASALKRKVHELSGGEQVRVSLAALVARSPALLLLDEPTNHLDLQGITWLSGFLSRWQGALVVSSHDRYFLEKVPTRILELNPTEVHVYRGAWEAFLRQKASRLEWLRREAQTHDETVARLSAYVQRYRAGSRARQAKSRQKAIERMGPRPTVPSPERRPGVAFIGGGVRLEVKDLVAGHGQPLVGPLSLTLEPGARLALVGPNGSGKSTFLSVLAGALKPLSGEIRKGPGCRPGYLDQGLSRLPEGETPLEVAHGLYGSKEAARRALAAMLFTGEEVEKPVDRLSGGERSRLMLLSLMAKRPTLLLLDEPTNHLDVESRLALEAALEDSGATVVVASHDRALLERLAETFLVLDGKGGFRLQSALDEPPEAGEAPEKGRDAGGVKDDKAPPARAPSVNLHKVRAHVAALEGEIERLEGERRDLLRRLSDPSTYKEAPEDAGKAADAFSRVEAELKGHLSAWEEAMALLEEKS